MCSLQTWCCVCWHSFLRVLSAAISHRLTEDETQLQRRLRKPGSDGKRLGRRKRSRAALNTSPRSCKLPTSLLSVTTSPPLRIPEPCPFTAALRGTGVEVHERYQVRIVVVFRALKVFFTYSFHVQTS